MGVAVVKHPVCGITRPFKKYCYKIDTVHSACKDNIYFHSSLIYKSRNVFKYFLNTEI